jgi:hypothetical protein
MQFPNLGQDDLDPYQQRIWLAALLTGMGDHADELVTRLPDDVIEAVLFYLFNMLNEAEADDSLGASWRQFLRLD